MRTLIRGLVALGMTAIAVPAMAQTTSSFMGGMNGASAIPKPANTGGPKMAPPAAVPGARSHPDSIAPASRAASDLPPTDALFDAINRGDMTAARDAVNRGADLDGTNVLGLTPLELSVDLSRNDITFMLLSMRGADGSMHGAAASQTAAAAAPPPPPTGRRRGAAPNVVAEASPRQPSATGVAAREAPPARPTVALYSGNGGTPMPSAGFLGFDAHR